MQDGTNQTYRVEVPEAKPENKSHIEPYPPGPPLTILHECRDYGYGVCDLAGIAMHWDGED